MTWQTRIAPAGDCSRDNVPGGRHQLKADHRSGHPPAAIVRAGRPAFLRGLLTAGAAVVAATRLSDLALLLPAVQAAELTTEDRAILRAAQIAEALAVTTYAHLVTTAPFFAHLFPQDQAYLEAARQQEMTHYLFLHGVTGVPSPYTLFFYPTGMFTTAPITLNTVVALEE